MALDEWRSGLTPRRVAALAGYVVLGVVGTAVAGLVALNLLTPLQAVVYDLFYLRAGPGEATETAILTHFLLSAVLAVAAAGVAGDLLSDRGENLFVLLRGFVALLALVLAFLVVALLGLAAFLSALLVLALGLVGVPLLLRYRYGVRSGALPVLVGAIPVVVLLLFLAGFGLGWGWGYVMTAEESPDASGDVADFDEVPQVRDDLFAGDCETTSDGDRHCYLQLRGYEHAMAAVEFLDRHGIRCPYRGTGSGGSFVAAHDGASYRVSCSPHGD